MAELASSSVEQPASKITFEVNPAANEVEVKYKDNPTWTHITKWNCGVVPATDDLQIHKELHTIMTLRKTFHDNLRVTLTRIRNRIHCIIFVFGHDNLDSAFQMAIKVDGVKATISKFLQEIDPNLRNRSLSCWVGEQNESSEQDNKNSDEKSESIVFSVTDNRKGCTSETDWTCSFGHDEFEMDLTSSRRTFTRLKSMFENSYRCFLKLVRRGSLIIECEHESREDALEMMKNHVKVKATILECLHEIDPRVNAIKIEVEYREIERYHLERDPSQLPEPFQTDMRIMRKQKQDRAVNELKEEMLSLKRQLRVKSQKLAELQRAQLSGTQMLKQKRSVSPPSSDSSGFGSASDTDTVVGDEDLQDFKGQDVDDLKKHVAYLRETLRRLKELERERMSESRMSPLVRPQPSDSSGLYLSAPETEGGYGYEGGVREEQETSGSVTDLRRRQTDIEQELKATTERLHSLGITRTRATPTPARRDPEADRDLLDASTKGDMAAMKLILAAGRADVNCRGGRSRTPVMAAAYMGHRDVMELLVSEGADVSLVDEDGDNTLHHACWGGDVETVKCVLSLHVVDINSRGVKSTTPVMEAAWRGYRDMVELLVREGADVSLVDEVGNNILHHASRKGDVETVKFVLSLKVVDIDARNKDGETAADEARREGHQEVVKLL